ncbi:VOC family protein [Microbacterium capsulatum]|uniref:VOC family protein n=1 Tax=Microbacterium capsulatum TaxID=3041921 RepID=A0ABU0XJX3_9MICO|nr:VOC family protein [Microbacterium sp. ASV81]MDQ4214878.1 VOC family protein [Microbacterium sp. ASV81]
MSQRIIPNIWCNRNAEDVGSFYASVFENASSRVTARYPTEGLPDFQQSFAGEAVVVDVDIDGYRISLINAGNEFHPNPAISFLVTVDPLRFGGDEHAARGWINRAWTLLGEEGLVLMDIGEYSFSGLYGWVEDKYGVSWQLKLVDPAADPVPPITPTLLFGGAVQGKGDEAIELYTSLLPDSGVGRVVQYSVQGEADAQGSIRFVEFRLAGQGLAAIDSDVDRDFSFTPGLSLQVDCDGQDEIDRLWDALSAVPSAEQCGWLIDRFGVSWQIVPANMAELMQRPHAYEHMMRMKKLVIADF